MFAWFFFCYQGPIKYSYIQVTSLHLQYSNGISWKKKGFLHFANYLLVYAFVPTCNKTMSLCVKNELAYATFLEIFSHTAPSSVYIIYILYIMLCIFGNVLYLNPLGAQCPPCCGNVQNKYLDCALQG